MVPQPNRQKSYEWHADARRSFAFRFESFLSVSYSVLRRSSVRYRPTLHGTTSFSTPSRHRLPVPRPINLANRRAEKLTKGRGNDSDYDDTMLLIVSTGKVIEPRYPFFFLFCVGDVQNASYDRQSTAFRLRKNERTHVGSQPGERQLFCLGK